MVYQKAGIQLLYRKTTFLFCLILFVFFFGCARKAPLIELPRAPREKFLLLYLKEDSHTRKAIWLNGKKYYLLSEAEGFVQYGKASWYGRKFHGRKTSSGEVYNMHERTAAHRTLPLGTYVQVMNLKNGKSTIVRINDRGPFVKGRIIDLSYRAAKDIGLVGPGVARVRLTVLGKEVGRWKSPGGLSPIVEIPNIRQGAFTVQVGAFRERDNALSIADRLKVLFQYVEVIPIRGSNRWGETFYRVRVSRSKTLDEANKIKRKLKKMGFEEAFVVSL
ncbi:MAG: septal ring lytic transglycosylase RlpA family protein [Deltaproteobacteria bacterium]|nr:septal ring lytic transglycosylase RlpA family protein [Deltaproteobacteria bacterium]MBW1929568.1 septal ring lytic transglycosylase RlpA family protein [Deltaproteobacteria bacterium]MBW2025079.1 septal ring lytic transglycosylase RlpA family protein [Deltaproteobacteria bacterium]MBW2124989.1 septal ring lytic transglycosylase RlpA family protein [Deltaproteobacteria bacterium]RLB14733.1 MAG: septal ring lytic transglycosylase RlpA family lipoprotein [Deltaproteobacteria bacterium]